MNPSKTGVLGLWKETHPAGMGDLRSSHWAVFHTMGKWLPKKVRTKALTFLGIIYQFFQQILVKHLLFQLLTVNCEQSGEVPVLSL